MIQMSLSFCCSISTNNSVKYGCNWVSVLQITEDRLVYQNWHLNLELYFMKLFQQFMLLVGVILLHHSYAKELKQMEGTNKNYYLELFRSLKKKENMSLKTKFSDTERFVCALYGMSSLSSVNEGWFQLFLDVIHSKRW